MMKIVKKIAWILLISLVVIQFITPEKNNTELEIDSAFLTETNPPETVKNVLRSSCYDCHSNNTEYPWYSNIAPVSFWIADHIKKGKRDLNFSEWEKYKVNNKSHKLEEVVETVDSGFMPLTEYTWTHANARLTDDQRKEVIEWAEKTRLLYELGQQPH